jgi:hypothetical protein
MMQISYLSVAPSAVSMQTGAISCVINYSKIQEKYFLTLLPPKNEIPSHDDSWWDFESCAIDNVRLSPSTTNRFQVQYTMSAGTIPEFKFPKFMFFPRFGLPNESHPWFDEFKVDAKQSVFHPVTKAMMEYPASLLNLEGLRDLEKETMLTEYHDLYLVIEKFKVIREANRL